MGLVLVRGRERLSGAHATGSREEQFLRLLPRLATADIPLIQPLVQRVALNRMNVLMQQAGRFSSPSRAGDTAGTVHMLNVVLSGVRGNLRQAGT